MQTTSANKLELLQIAESVAREKLIEPELVIEAMEESLAKAAKLRYGSEYDIRATIDPNSGELKMERYRKIVDTVENHFTEITVNEAEKIQSDTAVGSYVVDNLPPLDFGRIAAQSAKQVITQKVREAERARQYEEFKDRVGQIINGQVRRVEYGNVIVDLGRGEGVLKRDQLINREPLRINDRVRAIIKEVREETRGPQIFLSRTAPDFLSELFKMEVPEIYDGIIEIRSVARDPGSRAKIGVISHDTSIDPVGACVGMRGSRVQAVVNELQGEKIDIIPWNEDAPTFLVNALQPAEVSKVVLDEDAQRIEVVVPDEQLSLAIGRRGQNVRLASQLTGFDIDIMTEADESEKRQLEFSERTKLFVDKLNIDEMVAQLLVSEGFSTLEEVAYVDYEEIASIDGFDETTAEELQARAQESIEETNARSLARAKELGVDNSLIDIDGLSPPMIEILAEDGIKTLKDFATCADWELAGGYSTVDGKRVKDEGLLESFDMSLMEARTLIMNSRLALGMISKEDYELQMGISEKPSEDDTQS